MRLNIVSVKDWRVSSASEEAALTFSVGFYTHISKMGRGRHPTVTWATFFLCLAKGATRLCWQRFAYVG